MKNSKSIFLKTTGLFFKRFFSFILVASLIFSLSACGSSISDKIGKNSTWETDADSENSSIKWVFEGKAVKYVNVINGEDTFSQSFNYSFEGNKMTFESNYATLTFDVEIDGKIMTVKTESGETLIFKKR